MSHDHQPSAPVDHRGVIAAESGRFAELVDAGPLDAEVAGCPGWTVRDLAVHLGNVQRWCTGILQTGEPGAAAGAEPDIDALGSWFRTGTAALLDAIDASDPDAPCWNLWDRGEKTMRFWYRRQALEVAVHRWDAEAAVRPSPGALDAAVAADVIDEWTDVVLVRTLEKRGVDPNTLVGDVHLHCTDTPGEWTFEFVDGAYVVTEEHRKSAVAARGPASDLALFVYNRSGASGVEVFGDRDLLAAYLG